MIAVAGVLLVQDGKYVVQMRDNHPGIADPGVYSPWGGAVEGLESPEQGAVRELFEETGVQVAETDLRLLTQLSIEGRSERSKGQIVDVYLYAVEIGQEVAVNCYEGEGLARISSLQEVPEGKQSPLLTAAIEAYEQQ